MLARLERVKGGEALRTDVVEGLCDWRPTVGERLVIVAKALSSPTGFRFVSTSPVTSVVEAWTRESGTSYLFTTESGSQYRLAVLQ